MKRERDTLVFNSDAGWYELEARGVKPCTVRILSREEWREANVPHAKHIRIHREGEAGTCFTRNITYIGSVGELLGSVVVVVCWT